MCSFADFLLSWHGVSTPRRVMKQQHMRWACSKQQNRPTAVTEARQLTQPGDDTPRHVWRDA